MPAAREATVRTPRARQSCYDARFAHPRPGLRRQRAANVHRDEETMTVAIPTIAAREGAQIPAIGFGTSQLGDCAEIVATALKLGYRHIDTAWKYGSEKGVGEGIRASGVPRSEIFLTTKVSHEYLRAADFARSVDESLERLQVDYVDMLHVHWPSPEKVPLTETMPALAKAKREGLARHIGVANFNIALLEEAISACPEPLATLQAEYHPYLDQAKVLAACRRLGLVFTAYCPLARGRLFDDPVLGQIAAAKRRTVAQVALRWLMQQGNIAAIPRSGNPTHIEESLHLFDFELTPDEMQRISALKRPDGRIANPKGRAPEWD
jgi:diketogulonate reductase-like aldo/keto reductase